ncbi:MAG TPA: hypothetical protein DF613_07865 [Lachnospiraceae bacterium]|nr:hypothetical protein [Lachnospiraceae bacterium]
MKQTVKEKKGYYGYISRERRKRFFITLGLFALPLALFLAGYLTTHTTKNLLTVVAVVGCLPACKSLVGLIMVCIVKPMDDGDYGQIRQHAGDLLMSYELYITSYDNSEFICAAAVCGTYVIGYSDRLKNPPEILEEHIHKLLAQNGYKQTVKIFKDIRPFLERLDSLNKNKSSLESGLSFTPDPRYPDYDRNQMVRHVLLRLAL